MNPLTELVDQLESAIRAGDRTRAINLLRQIEQQLVLEHHQQAAIERRVRALMAEQNRPDNPALSLDPFDLRTERSMGEPESDGSVFPVWFGTNRKPHPGGNGFSGHRHDCVTRGRVEVYVPEGHRFGETGTSFWE